jgi:WD40 repeat protein
MFHPIFILSEYVLCIFIIYLYIPFRSIGNPQHSSQFWSSLESVRQLNLEREISFGSGLDCVHGVTFSDDGSILAAGFSQGKVALWDFCGQKFMLDFKTPNSKTCVDQVGFLFFNFQHFH